MMVIGILTHALALWVFMNLLKPVAVNIIMLPPEQLFVGFSTIYPLVFIQG